MERIREKLSILADAAKYDVSCSSSGGKRKNNGGIGNSSASGICHTYTEDGRCVSLLKILMTNICIYDCAFCVSRKSNDIPRAAFTVQEVVDLTMNFYRRNYIEGLFLSSGILKSGDHTMERMLQIVKKLRLEEKFNGYIHLKTIPGASEEMIKEAGLYADRMSINLEMPTEEGLKLVAPDKSHEAVKKPLGWVNQQIIQYSDERKIIKKTPLFVPAGQSTQMVVGATPETDMDIMQTAKDYYSQFNLKRVYYSAYIPIASDNQLLPKLGSQPPLVRENRLYQTDWLLRFYDFKLDEILNPQYKNLDTEIDPKLSWALRNLHLFPIDVQRADYQMLIRIPGVGRQSAMKIISARKFGKIREEHIRKFGIAYNRARFFMHCADSPIELGYKDAFSIRSSILERKTPKSKVKKNPFQLELFD